MKDTQLKNSIEIKNISLAALENTELLSVASAIHAASKLHDASCDCYLVGDNQATGEAIRAKSYEILSVIKSPLNNRFNIFQRKQQ